MTGIARTVGEVNKLERTQLIGNLGARFKADSRSTDITIMHSYVGGVEIMVSIGGTAMSIVVDPNTAHEIALEISKLSIQAGLDDGS